MVNKIRVYGKAQNRTALGIVNAYMVMYPHATFEDLKKAFPDALNPDSGVKVNFQERGKKVGPEAWDGFFDKDDEIITTGDGKKVALVKMWTKPSFERLVAHAEQYGIEIAKFEAADKGFGAKGGYRLEYLNGYVPPVAGGGKKGLPWWVWAILGALVVLILLLLLLRGCNKPEPEVIIQKEVVTVVDTVMVVDTVWMAEIEEIEKNFNAAQFKVNSAVLSEDAKFVLHDLAKVLNAHTEIRLLIQGHTSAEGDPAKNQKLSEARAKAAVDFLVNERGVNADQLQYEGKGSSMPLDPNNLEINRRTEFIVLE